jgi:hypothetical protein
MEPNEAFELLKIYGEIDVNLRLADDKNVVSVEKILNVKLPDSFILFQKEYSNIRFGTYEILNLLQEEDYLDIVKETKDARKYSNIPSNLQPFLDNNGDYFCFNTTTNLDTNEYRVEYFSLDGKSNERWINFTDWVVNCWIKEYLERRGKLNFR